MPAYAILKKNKVFNVLQCYILSQCTFSWKYKNAEHFIAPF